MLISHFLLDLQEASKRDVQLDTGDTPDSSEELSTATLNFARAVGSIATTLRHDNSTISLGSDTDSQEEEDMHAGMDTEQPAFGVRQTSRDASVLA